MAKIKCFSCNHKVEDEKSFSCELQGNISLNVRTGKECELYDAIKVEKSKDVKLSNKLEKE